MITITSMNTIMNMIINTSTWKSLWKYFYQACHTLLGINFIFIKIKNILKDMIASMTIRAYICAHKNIQK
jgi:hypothetical protein